IASWNPEKDLLAMVSTDHQLTVHRFNWQKLWTISPEKKITAICWRPDGKALAVGHENGEISLHDVEVLIGSTLHEDRTSRFFPPPPKPPAMPGTGPAFDMAGAFASGDDQENISQNAASKHSEQYLNILCSSDSNGLVCLNAFGLFAIGELNLHNFPNWKQLSAVKVFCFSDRGSGLKKLGKSIDAAGREIQVLIADHLQPAAEILAFRIGELLGLSRWRSQLQSIGLDEVLVNSVMENAGMLMVQVERFLHVVSDTVGQIHTDGLNHIGVLRGFNSQSMGSDGNEVEAVVLQLNEHLTCLDFSLYKVRTANRDVVYSCSQEKQLLLLLNERLPQCGSNQAWIMVLELEELPFISLKSQTNEAREILRFCTSNVSYSCVVGHETRSILQLDVIPPIAVSASRGLACVFAAQKRAMLYDLEEDEEEKDD
ncbi:hypothetical protein SELMODRAFT_89017, partial [Selaginella moellendorffii]